MLNTGCESWVDLEQDPNDDRIITFNDGYWHYLRAERHSNTGYIYLDDNQRGLKTII